MSRVTLVREPSDALAMSGPVTWAMSHLTTTLATKGISCDQAAGGDGLILIVASPASALAQDMMRTAGVAIPAAPEALALVPGTHRGHAAILACGSDARGLVYAILELADRAANAADPIQAMTVSRPIVEQPANPVRAIARLFSSDIEDKSWFYDRDFWTTYLTMLATQRFNRIHLALGLGYDFVRNVIDAYFLFAYPFLVDVPGYKVRAVGLSDVERDRNLAMLRFISDEAAARGLHFQLGLWMHAYEWVESPNANYTISGLTAENHAAYCRDALKIVLDACPGIAGVTFRVHGESGITEGNYDFWGTVFAGVVRPGRTLELNLHPKGVNQQLIDVAVATGLPVTISPKYTAEHMGLPYQQASIRVMEQASQRFRDDKFVSNLMNLSEGSLRYTRYGYADFLKKDRRFGVFGRMWPGTDRLLLWGDPAMAAGYSRSSSFGGYIGLEVCEPLSFKGRLGSGLPGGRNAYADDSLRPHFDFQKYLYTYRLFGRMLYNPDAAPEQWQRYLSHEFGKAAPAVEKALAHASRILPLVTSSHIPSCHYGWFWPEIYTHMPLVDETITHPYRDTDEPKRFGNVSALDPELFCKPEELADEIVQGKRSGRYSPLRVAAWIDGFVAEAEKNLAAAESTVADRTRPEFRRLAIDVRVETSLGRFFASELRSSVAYALYLRTNELGRLRQAVAEYRIARAAWLGLIDVTQNVYRQNITFGLTDNVTGHWADRLPALDADLKAMESKLAHAEAAASAAAKAAAAKTAPLIDLDVLPPALAYAHAPASDFIAGRAFEVSLRVAPAYSVTVNLHYRRVNQADHYHVAEMAQSGGTFTTTIPGDYTNSLYAMEYFFEVSDASGNAWMYPGFNETLNSQPYFVVPQKS